ncbi:MAG: hypothetical protein ACI9S8_000138 [Chlamydiales bacterium]|jgi:hypothetical protein
MVSEDYKKIESLLDAVVQSVRDDNIEGPEGALVTFGVYLETLLNSGKTTVEDWPLSFKSKNTYLCSLFKGKKELSESFIQLISRKIQQIQELHNQEGFHFISMGFCYHSYDDNGKTAYEYLQPLLKTFPRNAGFHMYNCLILAERKEYSESIKQINNVMKWAKFPEIYVNDILKIETRYLDDLIDNKSFKTADEFLVSMQSYYQTYFSGSEWILLQRQLMLFRHRLEDHKRVFETLEKVGEVIYEKTENERRRLVEVLGVFSAIIAFIILNVQIALSFTVSEAYWLMLAMGNILLIFSISMSYIFTKPSEVPFYHRGRFWTLVALMFPLIIIGIGIQLTKESVKEKIVEKIIVRPAPHYEGKTTDIKTEQRETKPSLQFQKLFIPRNK